jgi:cytochrome c2
MNPSARVVIGLIGGLATSLASGPNYAPWTEKDFPFTSTSLDLRDLEPQAVPMNITPRGLLLNLGENLWLCFDTELLRVAALWRGHGVTPEALAPLSYQESKNLKTRGGQELLPKPDGKIILWNGVYPGWQLENPATFTDPRKPQPSAAEPGRGPLPKTHARFQAIRLEEGGAAFLYNVADSPVEDRFRVVEGTVQRTLHLAPCARAITLVLARDWTVAVPAHPTAIDLAFDLTERTQLPSSKPAKPPKPPGKRWNETVVTEASPPTDGKDALAVDLIPLPSPNPWRRNVRACDIAFFQDGTAALVTFDGDVWIARNLQSDLGKVSWSRFASGLHEPMSLVIREEKIFVFDRNGIWRLRDSDANGECDLHELFSNVFPQSAETREFPNSLKLAPDGSFVIAKGGQQDSTLSELNGSVLRISADGQDFTVLGHGFRQPFAGVHPVTGLVTASDQEGHYTPTTPLYTLTRNEFHGFLSPLLPKEQYPEPIAEPLTWIPHQVNASAVSQVWLAGPKSKMGALNGSLIHLGFNRPELFRVLINERASRPQAAVVSLLRDFEVPALNATLNPADGCLYVTGFQVLGWGTTAKNLSALARIRSTGAPILSPKELAPTDKGILLKFDVSLDPKTAADRSSYSIESWHYRRTSNYGSPHLKEDGTPGQDWRTPSSAYLSQDGHAVFVALPDMKPVQQMRIGWGLRTPDGTPVEGNVYFTPHELTRFDPEQEGFGQIEIDLSPKPSLSPAIQTASVEEGKRLHQLMGCMACHTVSEKDQAKIGPSWKGLYGKKREIFQAGNVEATEDYLRESILDPAAKIVKGFEKIEAGMPIYAGVLSEAQIESLILYIKTL